MNSEDRALKSILQGKPVEKRIFVGYEGETKKKSDKVSRLSEIMAEVRMPWFCPSCKKVMKKQVDNKMWSLFGHCLECQVEEEHNMRINGTFLDYAEKKVLKNKISAIKEHITQITEWKNNSKFESVEPVNIDTGYVHKEKFELTPEMIKDAEDAINLLEQRSLDFENRLKELEDAKAANK
tara:strand:- start:819 stop:1361 length:543 start_codon:yes stop_codon:yes gene_type:complete